MNPDSHPDLQNLLEVNLIQEALFQLVEEKEAFASLLVVNHRNGYLTLSNEAHYIFLLPVVTAQIIKEVSDTFDFIFNRKKILIQLEHCKNISGFENQYCISVTDIILQTEKNGISKNNLFLRLLSELFKAEVTL